jgi:hypothetical protein
VINPKTDFILSVVLHLLGGGEIPFFKRKYEAEMPSYKKQLKARVLDMLRKQADGEENQTQGRLK